MKIKIFSALIYVMLLSTFIGCSNSQQDSATPAENTPATQTHAQTTEAPITANPNDESIINEEYLPTDYLEQVPSDEIPESEETLAPYVSLYCDVLDMSVAGYENSTGALFMKVTNPDQQYYIRPSDTAQYYWGTNEILIGVRNNEICLVSAYASSQVRDVINSIGATALFEISPAMCEVSNWFNSRPFFYWQIDNGYIGIITIFGDDPAKCYNYEALSLIYFEDLSDINVVNPLSDNETATDSLGDNIGNTDPVVETPLPQLNTETPYLETVERADYPIYEGPGYEYNFVQTVEVAGVYTIVEEAWGSEGHLWGRLKSGVGWIDLTENRSPQNAQSMISANFADASLLSSGNYDHCVVDTSEYMVQIAFRAGVTLRDFCFTALQYGEVGYQIGELYYHAAELTPERPLVVDAAFPGSMSMYGVSFTDPDGISRYYCVSTSGLDGSLVFSEYEP